MDDLTAETEIILNKLRESCERELNNASRSAYILKMEARLKEIDMIERVLQEMANDVVNDNMYEALGDVSDAIVTSLHQTVFHVFRRRKDPGDIFLSAVTHVALGVIYEFGDNQDTILKVVCFSALRTISMTEKSLNAIASLKKMPPNSIGAACECIRAEGLDEQIARTIDRYGDAFRVGIKTKAAR